MIARGVGCYLSSPSYGIGNPGREVKGLAQGITGSKCGPGYEPWSEYQGGGPFLHPGVPSL